MLKVKGLNAFYGKSNPIPRTTPKDDAAQVVLLNR